MRRVFGLVAVVGVWAGCSTAVKAQVVSPGDPVGFGRPGISNGLGYNINGSRGVGYMPGLYYPTDNQGPGVYFDPIWNGLNGSPRSDVAQRGYLWSPPWSANYRQGQARRKLFAIHRND